MQPPDMLMLNPAVLVNVLPECFSTAIPNNPLATPGGLVVLTPIGFKRVWPVSVPAVATFQIECEHCVVSMLQSWISWKQRTDLLVEKRCSNSLNTKYWTTATPGIWWRRSSEQGTSVI